MIKLEEIKIPLRNFVDGERTIEYLSWYIFPLSPQPSVSSHAHRCDNSRLFTTKAELRIRMLATGTLYR